MATATATAKSADVERLRLKGLRTIAIVFIAIAIVSSSASGQSSATRPGQSPLAEGAPAPRQALEVTPRLTGSATFTTNVERDEPGEESADLVLQFAPGINIDYRSGRATAALDYELRGLLVTVETDASRINQSLLAEGAVEIVADSLLLEARAGIDQRSDDDGIDDQIDDDDLIIAEDQSTVYSVAVGPQWRTRIAGLADASAGYRFTGTFTDSGDTQDNIGHALELGVISRPRLLPYGFEFDLSGNLDQRLGSSGAASSSDDLRLRFQAGLLGSYQFRQDLAAALRVGYERGDFFSGDSNADSGFYSSAGLLYTPSPRLTASAFWGFNDNEVRLLYVPNQRVRLEAGRIDRQVGSNDGVRYDGSATFRNRRVIVEARYLDEASDSQGVASRSVLGEDDFGAGLIDDDDDLDDDDELRADGTFGLDNNEFIRRRFDLVGAYRFSVTRFFVGGFYERRDFVDNDRGDESGFGLRGGVLRRLGGRTTALAGAAFERIESEQSITEVLWGGRVGLRRILGQGWLGELRYRYLERNSTLGFRDFQEHRITLLTTLEF